MKMNVHFERFATLLISAVLLLPSCGQSVSTSESQSPAVGTSSSSAVISAYCSSAMAQAQVTDTSAESEYYPEVSYSEFDLDESADGAVEIILNGSDASCDSDAVSLDGGVLKISAAGNYLLSGNFTGQILVEADKDANVHLILSGLTVESDMAPLCFVSAKNVCITLAGGTENTITDGPEYTFSDGEDEPDAALYSKTDLTINGSGSLTVNGNYKNGIVSKDDLIILGGTITVNAVYNGVKGKDSLTIGGRTLNVTAGNDAVKSSNDADTGRGWVVIEDGVINVQAGDDAIHAESWLIVTGGTIRIEESYEGLEGKRIEIYGGDIDVVSSDDAVNAASGTSSGQIGGKMTPPDGMGGGMTPSDGMGEGMTPPDGMSGGMTPPDGMGEGMTPPDGMGEGMTPPDGMGENMPDDMGGGMMMGGGMSEEAEEGVYILMAGGSLRAQGGNDIIDSNGTFEQTGGVIVTVGPSMTVYGEPDGVIDTNGTMALTAGTYVSFCRNAGNTLASVISNPAVTAALNGAETVTLTDEAGEELLVVSNGTKASTVLVVSDLMEAGENYVLQMDGTAYSFTAESSVQSLR